jgi:hypothetical protein
VTNKNWLLMTWVLDRVARRAPRWEENHVDDEDHGQGIDRTRKGHGWPVMRRIGIIGKGRLGSALGTALEKARHRVVYATPRGGHDGAVAGADVVVLAVPFVAIDEAISQAGDMTGRILWSCVNALKPDMSGLAVGFDTSAGEQVARLSPGARVVAAVPPFAEAIAAGRSDYGGRRASTFLCSDDAGAKAMVGDLVSTIGAEPVDAGGLVMSRLVEPAMMLVTTLAFRAQPQRDLALALLERREGGAP